MQESFAVLGIAFGIILTAFVVFRMLKGRLRRKEINIALPEIDPLPVTKEIGSPNPQTESPESVTDIVHITTPDERPGQSQQEDSILSSNPIATPSDMPGSVEIKHGQEANEEPTADTETKTLETPVTRLPQATGNLPAESSPQLEETTGISPAVEDAVVNEPTPTKHRRKLSPEERGGAYRGKRLNETQERFSEKTQRARRPEVICWQQSRKWFLGIEIPDEYGDVSQVKVTQGDHALTTSGNSRWPISTIYEDVSIQSSFTTSRSDLTLAETSIPLLLFKLSGQHLTQGRLIRYATSGTYLVVTPGNWIRNEQVSGIAQVPPKGCHIDGFLTHQFHLDSETNSRITFLTPEKEEIEIPNRNSQFELVGLNIDDASDEIGPLFGVSPPSIRAKDVAFWSSVQTIVIGEEGERRSGWRTSFKPDVEAGSVDLTPYMSNKNGGWFFVRIYDATEGSPIESLDFRFLKNLQAINVSQHNALPGETGHKPVTISIEWNNHGQCELLPSPAKPLSIRTNGTSTTIEIPPEPDFDRTEWTLATRTKSRVQIALLVERVWWTLCKKTTGSGISKWQDKPIRLSREQCSATSEHLFRIRFPKRRWTKEVHVGFQPERARTYRVEVTEQIVDIPLNHFEGVNQLEDFSKDHPLSLWMSAFPEQTIAILYRRNEANRQGNRRRDLPIRLNLRRLLKYLSRLERAAQDTSLSEMLDESRKNWSSAGVRAHREEYLLETACVITLSWRVMKSKGRKRIGRRKGWIKTLVKLAETNPSSLFAATRKYEMLIHGTKVVPSD